MGLLFRLGSESTTSPVHPCACAGLSISAVAVVVVAVVVANLPTRAGTFHSEARYTCLFVYTVGVMMRQPKFLAGLGFED